MQATRTLPRGIRNHNPGNIDRKPGVRWQGQAADQSGDPRFVVFESPKWGIRAIARVLITYQDARQARDGSRIDTIREIIARWAPPGENDTGAYARHVAALAAIGEDEALDVYDFTTMQALVKAIITHENGGNPYPDTTIEAGIRLAGIEPHKKPLIRQADVAGATLAGGATVIGALAETVQSQAPQAAAAASAIQPWFPAWAKTLLLLLVLAGIAAALVKQLHDRRSDAR